MSPGVALLALGLLGCQSPADLIRERVLEEGITVAVDDAFTEAERRELTGAVEDLRQFTSGRVVLRLVDEGAEHDITIERGHASDKPGIFAVWSPGDRVVKIDAEGLYAGGWDEHTGVRAIAINMAGQLLDIEMHEGPGVWSINDVTPDFTDADLVVCREAEVCP